MRDKGFDVLDSKNADNFNYEKTTILIHRGDMKRAEVLSKLLGIDSSNIIINKNETLFYDLSLIIGQDYTILPSYRNAILFQPLY